MWDTLEWVGALEPPHAHLSFDQWATYEWAGAIEPGGGLVLSSGSAVNVLGTQMRLDVGIHHRCA